MSEVSNLYTTQQVARMLSISDQRVRYMVSIGQAIPKGRIGNIHVFTLEEVDRLRNRPKRGRRPKQAK